MVRVRCRDSVNGVGNFRCDRPGSRRLVGDIPDAVITGVVKVAIFKHGRRRVLRVLNLDVFDRREVRLAVIIDAERMVVPVDRGRLRDRVVEHGFAGLLGAGHMAQDGAVHGVLRDIAERFGQLIVRHMRPTQIAEHSFSPVPAAGQQHVVTLRRQLEKCIAVGIVHVQQVHAFDRRPGRVAVGDDQLRRLGGDNDANVIDYRIVVVRGLDQPDDVFWNALCSFPGPGNRLCRVPGIAADIEIVLLAVPDDQERRIDDAFILRAFNLLQDRIAVDRYQYRRLGREHQLRRLVPEFRLCGARRGCVEVDQQLVDGDREVRLFYSAFDKVSQILHLLIGGVCETDVENIDIPNHGSSHFTICIDLRLEQDCAKNRRIVRGGRLDGYGGTPRELDAGKFLDLGLVNGNRRPLFGDDFLRPADFLGARRRGGGDEEKYGDQYVLHGCLPRNCRNRMIAGRMR